MTPQQVALIHDSFAEIALHSDQVAQAFFDRLFETAPHVGPLFRGDMAEQRVKFMATMSMLVNSLDNLEIVLGQAGYNLADVVRLNYYTTDVDGFLAEFDMAKSRLAEAGCRPSSTLLGVTRLAYPELLVEIEATAAK